MKRYHFYVIIIFAFLSLSFTSCGRSNTKSTLSNDSTNVQTGIFDPAEAVVEEVKKKEIETLVLHFSVNKSYYDGYGSQPYKNNYVVKIHMNGNVDIHMEIHYPYGGAIGEPEVADYPGTWVQRTIKRGANYVDYYDIEFNNTERDLNWCVDNECKSLYFTWDSFQQRDTRGENMIEKVDTIYVQ